MRYKAGASDTDAPAETVYDPVRKMYGIHGKRYKKLPERTRASRLLRELCCFASPAPYQTGMRVPIAAPRVAPNLPQADAYFFAFFLSHFARRAPR